MCIEGQSEAWVSAVTLEVESFGHARLDTQVKSSRGIFDIIARETHDGNDGILSGWQLVELDELNGLGGDERTLRIHKVVQQSIESQLVIIPTQVSSVTLMHIGRVSGQMHQRRVGVACRAQHSMAEWVCSQPIATASAGSHL